MIPGITISLLLLSATFYFYNAETKPTTLSDQSSDVKDKNELKDCKYGWTKNTNGEIVCLKGKPLICLEKPIIN